MHVGISCSPHRNRTPKNRPPGDKFYPRYFDRGFHVCCASKDADKKGGHLAKDKKSLG